MNRVLTLVLTIAALAVGQGAEGKAYFPHRGTCSGEFSNSAGVLHQQKYKSDNNWVNPIFTGVTIDNTMNDVAVSGATFKGTYGPVTLTANDRKKLFLADNIK